MHVLVDLDPPSKKTVIPIVHICNRIRFLVPPIRKKENRRRMRTGV